MEVQTLLKTRCSLYVSRDAPLADAQLLDRMGHEPTDNSQAAFLTGSDSVVDPNLNECARTQRLVRIQPVRTGETLLRFRLESQYCELTHEVQRRKLLELTMI